MKNTNLSESFNLKNIPNILTIVRILLIIPIIYFLEVKNSNPVWYLLLFAGLTDYLDGLFARWLNSVSKIGSILDPLADKIIIIIPLIWLCKENIIPYWSLSIITLREFIITAARSTSNDGMPASRYAKYKTLLFFISLILIFSPFKENNITNIGLIIYWIGFFLNIISSISYLTIKKKFI